MTARSHWRAIFGDWANNNPSSNPTITLTGLSMAQLTSAPVIKGTRKATADTTLTRGASIAGKLLLVSIRLLLDILGSLLLAPALKLIQQVVERKAHGGRFFEEAVDQLGQMFFVLFAMTCGEMAGADECSHASSCFEYSRTLQLGVNLGHRVGVDAQFDRQLSDGWELLTDPKPPRGDRELNRPRQLRVKRHRMRRAE